MRVAGAEDARGVLVALPWTLSRVPAFDAMGELALADGNMPLATVVVAVAWRFARAVQSMVAPASPFLVFPLRLARAACNCGPTSAALGSTRAGVASGVVLGPGADWAAAEPSAARAAISRT